MGQVDCLKPKYRYQLRAKISEAGFRTITKYSEACGVGVAKISRVVSGWELPGLKLSHDMASTLGLSLDELGELFE